MARCSVAKPFCATTATPCLSRHGRRLSANATTPAMSTSKAGLPALSKPAKPPPPPLLSRPKLPVPTNTATDTTSGKDCTKKPKPPPEATDSHPSSSGAGDVLHLMDALGIPPDEDIYISLLRECAGTAEVASMHAHITARCASDGLPSSVANRVLLSYAACGDIEAARQVFDGMPTRNGMAWVTMVSAYSDGCFHHKVMCLFADMCHRTLVLDGDCCCYIPGVLEGVTLLEFEGASQEEEPEVQATEEAAAMEELPECPDHRPSSFLKDDLLYQGFCKYCLHPAGDED